MKQDNLRALISNDVVVSKIRETMDYSKFKFHVLNRNVNEHQVRVLAESLTTTKSGEGFNDYKDDTPLLVEYDDTIGKLIILDGQHRLTTRKALGLPIYYKLASRVGIHDVPNLNGTNKKWDLSDYVMTFTEQRKSEYVKLTKFVDKFAAHKMSIGSAIRILGYHDCGIRSRGKNSSEKQMTHANVRIGNFIFPDKVEKKDKNGNVVLDKNGEIVMVVCKDKYNNHVINAKNILKIGDMFNKGFHRNIVSAYLSHLNPTEGYDNARMVTALMNEKKRTGAELVMPNKTKDLAKMLNEIYNYGLPQKSRLLFNNLI